MAETENPTAVQIARMIHVTPRTTKFVLRDEYGFTYSGGRTEHVLAALQNPDRTPELDQRTRICAIGLGKCFITGRMNFEMTTRVLEATPYQICALLARIAALYQGFPTIGDLADTWINAHREELTAA